MIRVCGFPRHAERSSPSRRRGRREYQAPSRKVLGDRVRANWALEKSIVRLYTLPMRPTVRKGLLGVGALLAVAVIGGGAFLYSKIAAYDASMEKVYDIVLPKVQLSTDPEVLARGEHLTRSLASCAIAECHGSDFSGGRPIELGPLGTITGPNITGDGLGAVYSDGELARLILHGIKKDGRSVTFMPAFEFNWLPESDINAVISYIRSRPNIQKGNGISQIGLLGKFLDRQGRIKLNVAERIDHKDIKRAPPPEPTAGYGSYVARLCTGCHGDGFAGGAIPGAPPEIPIPSNITPHESGIGAWSYEDFTTLLDTGIRKNGAKLNAFMPLEALNHMDETERKALWEYLRSLPPRPFGER